MTSSTIRNRIASGYLATALLSFAVAGLAHAGVPAYVLTFGSPPVPRPTAFAARVALAPWFRQTFILLRADARPPLGTIVVAPAVASSQPPPGVVQNLRRADQR